MFQLKVFIVMVLIAGALGKPKDCKDGGKHHEKMKKIKQCHQQTMDLAACCDFPEPEMKDEYPECNEILEGLVEMEKKEQHKAMMCYVECIFKAEEVFDGENIDTDKMLADIEMMLEKADEAPFMNVSRVSVNFCQEKIEENQIEWKAKMAEWAEKHKDMPKKDEDGEDKKKCSFLPAAMAGCIVGNVVRNCPAEKWNNSDECEQLREEATTMEECMKW